MLGFFLIIFKTASNLLFTPSHVINQVLSKFAQRLFLQKDFLNNSNGLRLEEKFMPTHCLVCGKVLRSAVIFLSTHAIQLVKFKWTTHQVMTQA
jgi:hypothetical protein